MHFANASPRAVLPFLEKTTIQANNSENVVVVVVVVVVAVVVAAATGSIQMLKSVFCITWQ